MFESFTLTNFQVHRRLEIEFSRRITTIVGESDAGKSAILRALRWVCLNESSGGIRTHGTKKTTAVLIAGHRQITRARSSTDNLYRLDEHVYRAFKTDMPGAIDRHLRVARLNFQDQHDAPFWFNESAGEVSRQLNSIVNLGVIDHTLSNVDKELRKARATYDVTEKRWREARGRRDKLRWIVQCDRELSTLERRSKRHAALQAKARSLRALLANALALEQDLERLKERLHDGQAAVRLGVLARSRAEDVETLGDLVREYKRTRRLARIELPKIHTLDFAMNRRMQLEELLEEYHNQKSETDKLCIQWSLKDEKLQEQMKGRCPLCQRPMT